MGGIEGHAEGRPADEDERLAENHSAYFVLDSSATLISLDRMRPTKPPESQPDSVDRAEGLMRRAARGEIERRAPISVRRDPDGTFAVLNGNATFGVAA